FLSNLQKLESPRRLMMKSSSYTKKCSYHVKSGKERQLHNVVVRVVKNDINVLINIPRKKYFVISENLSIVFSPDQVQRLK
ncbi:MAG TPA: hypothetical protein PLR73_13610, partial [Acetivibrio sp.]|nr:hypothetical protein [Acetivibrio sp.]